MDQTRGESARICCYTGPPPLVTGGPGRLLKEYSGPRCWATSLGGNTCFRGLVRVFRVWSEPVAEATL